MSLSAQPQKLSSLWRPLSRTVDARVGRTLAIFDSGSLISNAQPPGDGNTAASLIGAPIAGQSPHSLWDCRSTNTSHEVKAGRRSVLAATQRGKQHQPMRLISELFKLAEASARTSLQDLISPDLP
jgi:hypothetical protein